MIKRSARAKKVASARCEIGGAIYKIANKHDVCVVDLVNILAVEIAGLSKIPASEAVEKESVPNSAMIQYSESQIQQIKEAVEEFCDDAVGDVRLAQTVRSIFEVEKQ